jgi:hypothetical protein
VEGKAAEASLRGIMETSGKKQILKAVGQQGWRKSKRDSGMLILIYGMMILIRLKIRKM